MKRILIILAAIFIFSSCHTSNNQDTTRTFTDDYNRTISVPSEPQRIVSASPAVTEIIFALGAGDRLVGRTDFCTYPEQAANIPSIGGITNLNVEQILSLNPDIVISGSMMPEKSVEQLSALGVPMACVIEKTQFDGLYENISRIGQLIGRTHAADSLNQVLRHEVSSLCTPDTSNVKTIYYVIGFGSGGNYTAGGNTFINDLFRLVGVRNIAADIEGWSYSLEALMHQNPDYILVREQDSAAFCSTTPYCNLTAVRQGRVISVPAGLLDLQTPRNIEAVTILRHKIDRLQ